MTEIITHPASAINVVESEDITLTCSASINGVIYSWHRVDGSIPSRSLGKDNHTLTITKVTSRDKGMYYCIASKEGIVAQSNRSVVIVNGKE